MRQSEERQFLSRRSFLKGAAGTAVLTAGGALAVGCAPGSTEKAAESESVAGIDPTHVENVGYDYINTENTKPIDPVEPPEAWDHEADVVIIGTGAGGLYASAALAEAGLSVIAIEAQSHINGTSQDATWMGTNGGIPSIYGTWGTIGDPYDPEAMYDHWMNKLGYSVSPDLLRKLVDAGPAAYEWLISQGLDLCDIMEDAGLEGVKTGVVTLRGSIFPPGQSILTYGGVPGHARGCKPMMDAIAQLAEKNGAEFFTLTPAKALVVSDGRVVGVKAADQTGNDLYFKAEKAVLLHAGDFSYNRDMLLQYTPKIGVGAPNAVEVISNNGDCARMAMGLGASMIGINSYSVRDGTIDLGLREVSYRSMFYADEALCRQPWLRFNKAGERLLFQFSGDGGEASHAELTMSRAAMGTFGHREYVIFDGTYGSHVKNFGQGAGRVILDDSMPWMDDPERTPSALVDHNFDEAVQASIEKEVIKSADTIAGLAEKLEVDPQKLEALVEEWNRSCEAGQDSGDYGYKPEWMIPIKEPPFYGAKMGASIQAINTGLKVNTDMQVLDRAGDPIPGLYAGFHTAGGAAGDCLEGDGIYGCVSKSLVGGRMTADGVLTREM